MGTRSFFVWGCLLGGLLTTGAGAAIRVDLDALREKVERHIASHYQTRMGVEGFENRVNIAVGELDPRLNLRPCEGPLEMNVREPARSRGNITVKTACSQGQRWTIYVPARVEVYAEVAVASRTLARGHIISEADVRFERGAVSGLSAGYVKDIKRLLGLELQRPMRPGDAFQLATLALPQVVKRGDKVMVEAGAGGLTVVAPGKALTSGKVGEQIRVENTQSQRVIDARIVAPGRVQVLL